MARRNAFTALLGATLLFTTGASADSMRCGNRLVSSGDSLHEVAKTCGDPDFREHRIEYEVLRYQVPTPCPEDGKRKVCYAVVERSVPITIDEWTYDFGRNRFVQRVRFEDGALVSVKTLGHGHKQ